MSIRRSLLITVMLVTAGLLGGGFAALASDGGKVHATAEDRRPPAGAEFIRALAARDFTTAQATLAPDIEFKGHTPSMGFVERKGSEAVMSLMREWYATAEALESLETGRVVERRHVGYRIRWKADQGPMVFEQQAYYDVDDRGQISRWHFVCSGDQPVPS